MHLIGGNIIHRHTCRRTHSQINYNENITPRLCEGVLDENDERQCCSTQLVQWCVKISREWVFSFFLGGPEKNADFGFDFCFIFNFIFQKFCKQRTMIS